MPVDIKEKVFEKCIEDVLLAGGYIKRLDKNFDRSLALDTEILVSFLKQSQPDQWKELEDAYGLGVEEEIKKGCLKILKIWV